MKQNKQVLFLAGSLGLFFVLLSTTNVHAATMLPKSGSSSSAPKSFVGKNAGTNHARPEHFFGTVTGVDGASFTISPPNISRSQNKNKSLKNNKASTYTVNTDSKIQTQMVGKKGSDKQTSSVQVGDRVLVMGTIDKATGVVSAARVMVIPGAAEFKNATSEKFKNGNNLTASGTTKFGKFSASNIKATLKKK